MDRLGDRDLSSDMMFLKRLWYDEVVDKKEEGPRKFPKSHSEGDILKTPEPEQSFGNSLFGTPTCRSPDLFENSVFVPETPTPRSGSDEIVLETQKPKLSLSSLSDLSDESHFSPLTQRTPPRARSPEEVESQKPLTQAPEVIKSPYFGGKPEERLSAKAREGIVLNFFKAKPKSIRDNKTEDRKKE